MSKKKRTAKKLKDLRSSSIEDSKAPGALLAQSSGLTKLTSSPEMEEETFTVDTEVPDDEEQIENDDGSVDIFVDEGEAPSGEHDENLALSLPEDELDALATKYFDHITKDKEARKQRDEQQEEGLKKAGLGGPAPGGAEFDGASRVTHPVLIEAYVDFAASTIRELCPPNGPVRTQIIGRVTDEKLDRAQRKCAYLNKKLTKDIKEYRPELERLLTQLPVGGSQYMKIYRSKVFNRTSVEFVPVDKIILPYSAKSFYTARRKFHEIDMVEDAFSENVATGLYRDVDTSPPSAEPDKTKTEQQTDKIEGKSDFGFNDDGTRRIYEGCVYEKIGDDERAKPYILILDEYSRKILGIYRNWEETNPECDELEYLVEFTFIPWRGAYGLGLPQLIGEMATAMTGALRSLLDSALIANSQTMVRLKTGGTGESVSIPPTGVAEIGALGSDDIRKIAMPLQFNGPSPVLLQLLGFLSEAAKGVVTTSEEKIADATGQMPVGTTIALIEQGAKIYSSIHARLHESQRKVLEIVHRLEGESVTEKTKFGEDDADFVEPKDFVTMVDVYPVSDPNIFSETQRYAQIQALLQLASTAPPGMYDIRKIHERLLDLMKVPNPKEVLPEPPLPKPLNPAAENISMCMGKPVGAFPDQDHLAHIQIHLDFAQDPLFGGSMLMKPAFVPAALEHVKQHMLFYYVNLMRLEASQLLKVPVEQKLAKDKSWKADQEVSVALAQSLKVVHTATKSMLDNAQPVVDMMLQYMQSLSQGRQDPAIMVAMQELQLRDKKNQTDAQLSVQRLQQQKTKMDTDAMLKLKSLEQQLQKLQAQIMAQADRQESELENELEIEEIRSRTTLEKERMGNEMAAANNLVTTISDAMKPTNVN